MSTLLLRLAAPLQAWGLGSKFDRRNTQREPTKSGIIGLVAAALGRRRHEDIQDLAMGLRFGLRVDREGQLLMDYQTVEADKPYVTKRYYLQDAVFLVGLQGEERLLKMIHQGLLAPYFPLYLGRRSCPPEGKLVLGITALALEDALQSTPCLIETGWRHPPRILMDADYGTPGAWTQRDAPLSFDRRHRRFEHRAVRGTRLKSINNSFTGASEPHTDHDAMGALEPPAINHEEG